MPLLESFVKNFSTVFFNDDVEGIIGLFDNDSVWVMMPTGETFRGLEQIRKMVERSVDARKHTEGGHMELKNLFATDDQMVLEYVLRGIATKPSYLSVNLPVSGTEFVLPICLVCHVRNGKIDGIDEYFDAGTLTGERRRMYSEPNQGKKDGKSGSKNRGELRKFNITGSKGLSHPVKHFREREKELKI